MRDNMEGQDAFTQVHTVEETPSTLVSKNITVLGRRTSVRLEPEMWSALKDIARRERCTNHDLCSLISLRKSVGTSLTAAIRVFLMLYYKAASTEDGHARAGHGDFEVMKRRARVSGQIGTHYRIVNGGYQPSRDNEEIGQSRYIRENQQPYFIAADQDGRSISN